ncbi:MAG: hypothetical protein HYY04_17595 [Chloroflexi bacterium]|nr:hypothetical protein [Chloroflexota bacterium]
MAAEEKGAAGQAMLRALGRIEIGDGKAHDRMVVFPAYGGSNGGQERLRYRTLQEAIAEGGVEVTERPSATVPELVLRNRSETMVLVVDGEEIVGGRQNRIVNASFLVAGGATVVLPVSCVEQGRWREVSPRFSAGEASFFSLRREKQAQVRESLSYSGRPTADQGAIWEAVARQEARMGSHSPSGAMHDIYRTRSSDLASYERAFPYVADATGLIVAMNGQVAGAELFDQPRTADVLWAKLVRSYALDAVEGEAAEPVTRDAAVRFLERTRDARYEVYPSLALGEDVRLAADGVIGAGLVYAGVLVHVSLFRTVGPVAGQGRMARASVRQRQRE